MNHKKKITVSNVMLKKLTPKNRKWFIFPISFMAYLDEQ